MAEKTGTRRARRAAARAERLERERAEAARARQRKRLFQLGGAFVLAAAVVLVIVLATGGGSDGPERRAGESIAGQQAALARYRGIPQDGNVLGDPRAPVTLVEFADLQCPFCKQYAEEVLPTLVDDYVRPGTVRMVFENLAFLGTDSVRGAQMAGAVGLQGRLFEFVDIFYANQGAENSGYVTDEFLRDVAGAIPGVDVERAMNERGAASVQRALERAQQRADEHGIQGTPSFLIGPTGGELEPLELTSGFAIDEFTTAIDKALAKARS